MTNFDLWFLRRFLKFRITERQRNQLYEHACGLKKEKTELQRKVVSDSNLIESLNRYIEALEGRDKERVKRIDELERVCCEAQRNDLSGIPGNKSGAQP